MFLLKLDLSDITDTHKVQSLEDTFDIVDYRNNSTFPL